MITQLGTVPDATPDPADLRGAAAAFEALFLQQMLKSALPEQEGSGSLGLQALATQLARGSPFGIARLLEGNAQSARASDDGSVAIGPNRGTEGPLQP